MAISSRRTAVPPLRKAVDAYRAEHKAKLQNWALELLDRLANSADAAQAFERLKLNGREREFLMLCILVVELARTFSARILTEQRMSDRLPRLEKAITDLRLFVSEQLPPRSDLLIPRVDLFPMWGFPQTMAFSVDTLTAMMGGLRFIAEAIDKRRGIGETVMAELKATRKKHHKNAPNIAAIRLLAVGVRGLTGKRTNESLSNLHG